MPIEEIGMAVSVLGASENFTETIVRIGPLSSRRSGSG